MRNFWSSPRLQALPRMSGAHGTLVATARRRLHGNPATPLSVRKARFCLLPHADARDRQARHHGQLSGPRLHRTDARPRRYREQMEKQTHRAVRPAEEIAGLAAFLMTPRPSYITGAVLPVDGS